MVLGVSHFVSHLFDLVISYHPVVVVVLLFSVSLFFVVLVGAYHVVVAVWVSYPIVDPLDLKKTAFISDTQSV